MRRTQLGSGQNGNFAIRRPCITDREALREFLAGLSPRARYLRFFAGAPPSEAMLRILAGGSGRCDVLVATRGDVIIGHAMAGDRTGPGGTRQTEIGVVVADASRGRGVGSALVRGLLARARQRGATAVVMEVLAENRQVLTMISDHWPGACQEGSGAYVTISAGIPAEVAPRPDREPGPAPETVAAGTGGGTVEHLGSRTALATARLTGEGGKLYAQAASSCMIFRPGG